MQIQIAGQDQMSFVATSEQSGVCQAESDEKFNIDVLTPYGAFQKSIFVIQAENRVQQRQKFCLHFAFHDLANEVTCFSQDMCCCQDLAEISHVGGQDLRIFKPVCLQALTAN